jgi:hypothetical protein
LWFKAPGLGVAKDETEKIFFNQGILAIDCYGLRLKFSFKQQFKNDANYCVMREGEAIIIPVNQMILKIIKL